MVSIRRHLAPLTRTSGRGNTKKYITIHETANRGRGAGAASHARLQANTNSRQASWHYQVDDTEIVQSFDDDVKCWHAGGTANSGSIAIEICVNSDSNYNKALDNAAALVAHLRKKHGIPWNRVVSHNFWTGKNCPTIMLSKTGTWDRFIAATDPNSAGKVSTGSPSSGGSSSKPSKNERTDAWLKKHLPRITSGTSKNSVGHLVGLYQRQQISPYTLVHDQHWGKITDQHYRWVHALQVELNKWKGTKIEITKTWDKQTRDRVIEWQTRNMGGEYKGTIADGVVGPLTTKPLGLKAYPN